jgi:D-hexose-6-phosphate mutarotase
VKAGWARGRDWEEKKHGKENVGRRVLLELQAETSTPPLLIHLYITPRIVKGEKSNS